MSDIALTVTIDEGSFDRSLSSFQSRLNSAFTSSTTSKFNSMVSDMQSRVGKFASSAVRDFDKMRGAFAAILVGFNSLVKQTEDFAALEGSIYAFSESTEAAASTMQFLKDESMRLGVNLGAVSGSFKKLSIAGQLAGFESAKIREIFTALGEASSVAGMSTEELSGAFRAITQMMSKGKVQAEELRGQLGEHLPGAFEIAAKSMGKTTAELDKMLSMGQITAKMLLKEFPAALREAYGGDLERFLAMPTRRLNAMRTEWGYLITDIGEGTNILALMSQAWSNLIPLIKAAATETSSFFTYVIAMSEATAAAVSGHLSAGEIWTVATANSVDDLIPILKRLDEAYGITSKAVALTTAAGMKANKETLLGNELKAAESEMLRLVTQHTLAYAEAKHFASLTGAGKETLVATIGLEKYNKLLLDSKNKSDILAKSITAQAKVVQDLRVKMGLKNDIVETANDLAGGTIKLTKAQKDAQRALNSALEDAKSPLDNYTERVAQLNAWWTAGSLNQTQFNSLLRQAAEEYYKTSGAAEVYNDKLKASVKIREDLIEAENELLKAEAKSNQNKGELIAKYNPLIKLQNEFNKEVADIALLFGRDTPQAINLTNKALEKYERDALEAAAASGDLGAEVQLMWEDFGEGIEDNISGLFSDVLKGEEDAWSNFTDRIKDMFFDMLADMAAKLAVSAVMDFLSGNFGGGFGSALGSLASGAASLFGGGDDSSSGGGALDVISNGSTLASASSYYSAVSAAWGGGYAAAGSAAEFAAFDLVAFESITAEGIGATVGNSLAVGTNTVALGETGGLMTSLSSGLQTMGTAMQTALPYLGAAAFAAVAVVLVSKIIGNLTGSGITRAEMSASTVNNPEGEAYGNSQINSQFGDFFVKEKHSFLIETQEAMDAYVAVMQMRVTRMDEAIVDFLGDKADSVIEAAQNYSASYSVNGPLDSIPSIDKFLMDKYQNIAEVIGGDFAEGFAMAYSRGADEAYISFSGNNDWVYDKSFEDFDADSAVKIAILYAEATQEIQDAYQILGGSIKETANYMLYFSEASDVSKQTLLDLTAGLEVMTTSLVTGGDWTDEIGHMESVYNDSLNAYTDHVDSFAGITQDWIDSIHPDTSNIGSYISTDGESDWISSFEERVTGVQTTLADVITNFVELDFTLQALKIETLDFTKENYVLYEGFKEWAGGLDGVIAKVSQMYNINTVLSSIGASLFDMSIAGIQASDALVNVAGGLDALSSKILVFFDSFASDVEKGAMLTNIYSNNIRALNEEFGTNLSTNVNSYASMVKAMIGSSDISAELKNALLDLAPVAKGAIDAQQQLNTANTVSTDLSIANAEKLAKVAADMANSVEAELLKLQDVTYQLLDTTDIERTKRVIEQAQGVINKYGDTFGSNSIEVLEYIEALDLKTQADIDAIQPIYELADAFDTLRDEAEKAAEEAEALAEKANNFTSSMKELAYSLEGESEVSNLIRQINEVYTAFGYTADHTHLASQELADYIRTLDGTDEATREAEESIKKLGNALIALDKFIANTQNTIDSILSSQAVDAIDLLIDAENARLDLATTLNDVESERYENAIQANETINDFLENLKISDLKNQSPLEEMTASAQLFNDAVNSGDADKATGYAQDYLQFAQKFYASTGAYDSIFNNVTSSLENMLTNPGPAPIDTSSSGSATLTALEAQRDAINEQARIDALYNQNVELVSALNDMALAKDESIFAIASQNGIDLQALGLTFLGGLDTLNAATVTSLAELAVTNGWNIDNLVEQTGIEYGTMIQHLLDIGLSLGVIRNYEATTAAGVSLTVDKVVELAVANDWNTMYLANQFGISNGEVIDQLLMSGVTLNDILMHNAEIAGYAAKDSQALTTMTIAALDTNSNIAQMISESGYSYAEMISYLMAQGYTLGEIRTYEMQTATGVSLTATKMAELAVENGWNTQYLAEQFGISNGEIFDQLLAAGATLSNILIHNANVAGFAAKDSQALTTMTIAALDTNSNIAQMISDSGYSYAEMISYLMAQGYTLRDIYDYEIKTAAGVSLTAAAVVDLMVANNWSTQFVADQLSIEHTQVTSYLQSQGWTLAQIKAQDATAINTLNSTNSVLQTIRTEQLSILANTGSMTLLSQQQLNTLGLLRSDVTSINADSAANLLEAGYGGNYTDNSILEYIARAHIVELWAIRDSLISIDEKMGGSTASTPILTDLTRSNEILTIIADRLYASGWTAAGALHGTLIRLDSIGNKLNTINGSQSMNDMIAAQNTWFSQTDTPLYRQIATNTANSGTSTDMSQTNSYLSSINSLITAQNSWFPTEDTPRYREISANTYYSRHNYNRLGTINSYLANINDLITAQNSWFPTEDTPMYRQIAANTYYNIHNYNRLGTMQNYLATIASKADKTASNTYTSAAVLRAWSGQTYVAPGVGYEQGTNFVPEDQYAFLHKGEAVIPAEYNSQLSNLGVSSTPVQDNREIVSELKALREEVSILRKSNQTGNEISREGFKQTVSQQTKMANSQQEIAERERING